jgi:DNA-directed RNA polymerase specialized sigma24 family protein
MDAPARKPPNAQKQRRTNPNGQGRADSRPEPATPHTRPDPNSPPDIQRLTEICSKIVKEKAHLFAAVKGSMGNDDLLQIALIRAIQVHPDYDPTRGNYGPFISIRVKNTLLDTCKSKHAAHRRDQKVSENKSELSVTSGFEEFDSPEVDAIPIPDLAAQVLEVATRTMPRFARGSWRRYTSPQLVTIAVARRVMNQSYRGIVMVLEESDTLRDSLKLSVLPSYAQIKRFEEKVGEKVLSAMLRLAVNEIQERKTRYEEGLQ